MQNTVSSWVSISSYLKVSSYTKPEWFSFQCKLIELGSFKCRFTEKQRDNLKNTDISSLLLAWRYILPYPYSLGQTVFSKDGCVNIYLPSHLPPTIGWHCSLPHPESMQGLVASPTYGVWWRWHFWLLMLGNKRWYSFHPALSLSRWIHVWGLLSQQVKSPAPLKLSCWRDHVKNLLRDIESRSNSQLVQSFQIRYQTWTWKLLWWHQLQSLPGYSLKSDPKPELHTQLQFLTHRNSKRK